MPVPQHKTSKARTRSRRANHDKLTAKNVGWCPNCGARKLSHHICTSCGTYRGRQVLPVVTRVEE